MECLKKISGMFTKSGFFLFYILAFLITIFIFMLSTKHSLSDPQEIIDYADHWYYDVDMTQCADLKHPSSDAPQYGENVSIYYYSRLPYDINTGKSLWMKAKNCALDIFLVDEGGVEEIVYSLGEGDHINGRSKGTVWISIPVDRADSGKIIKMHFRAMYDDTSCYVDELKYGPEGLILKKLISERIVGTVTSIVIMLVGLILMIVHFFLKKINIEGTENLVYLGLFAVATAFWSFSEIKLLQLFDVDSGAAHNLSCMMLALIAMPLFLYFKRRDTNAEKAICFLVMVLTIIDFAGCCALHFLGIYDFHTTMTFSHIVLGVASLGIIFFAYLSVFKNPQRSPHDISAAVGLAFLGIMAIADIIRYKFGGVNDSAMLTRIGLLVYISILGVNSLAYTVEMVKKGLSADIVSRLAYQDGLTELGNRTAYMEKLTQIQSNSVNTIFMFDINNLKTVNDGIGHIAGDRLIIAGADLIKAEFSDIGSLYRIGGDEFVCIVEDETNIDEKIQDFLASVDIFNQNSNFEFPVTLAIGGAKWVNGQDMDSVINEADHNMYECKKLLKDPSEIR